MKIPLLSIVKPTDQVCRRLEGGDPHVHTHQYGDALLKQDFAADSRKYELDLEKGGYQ